MASAINRLRVMLALAVLSTIVTVFGPANTEALAAPPVSCGSGSLQGTAFVFVRPSGANGLGHVGWGYVIQCGTGPEQPERLCYGSVENPAGSPVVPPGQNIGWWQECGALTDMKQSMLRKGYTLAKKQYRPRGLDKDAAYSVAVAKAVNGYNVVGNNCANATWDVLKAYGATHLGSLQALPSPNRWFQHLPSAGGWKGPTEIAAITP